jgi:hypothetical protein
VYKVEIKEDFIVITFSLNEQTRLEGATLHDKIEYLEETIELLNKKIAARRPGYHSYDIDFLTLEDPVYMKSVNILFNLN